MSRAIDASAPSTAGVTAFEPHTGSHGECLPVDRIIPSQRLNPQNERCHDGFEIYP
jgi:hypothetical protein